MIVIPYFIIPSTRQQLPLLLLAVSLLLSACQTSPVITPSVDDYGQDSSAYQDKSQTLARLYQQHNIWHGTPYRLGGNSRAGIDCSAFVQLTFDNLFNIQLPRTTSQQVRSGKQIGRSDLQAGDLVFFRAGRHVGIYLEDGRFLHASTRLGVTISRLDNVYWSRYYWRSIRVKPQH